MALTEIELGKKAKDGTLTFGEAWNFAMSKAGKSAKTRINALKSGAKTMGISFDTPYKDLKQEDIIKLFTVEGSPDAKNRAYNLQTLETVVRPVLEKYGATGVLETVAEGVEQTMYPQLAGATGLAGTQRTGLAGERPMRGLLPKEDLDKIYDEALPLIEAEHGKSTANLIAYHRATANRPEQLLGLKKSDVTIAGDIITVKGKVTTKKDHKGRPELSFDVNSRLGRILKESYDASTSEYLFDVSDGEFTTAFNKHISPRLEPFDNILPAKEVRTRGADGEIVRTYEPIRTPSAIRSIVPRYLMEQYNVNENFVEGMMGHVNPSILKKNYAGFVPQKDLPALLENPADFAGGEFGVAQPGRVNLDLLTDDQRAALASEQQQTILAEERAKQSQAAAAQAEAQAKRTSTLAAITPEEIQAAEDKARAMEEAKIKGRQAAKEAASMEKPDVTSFDDLDPDLQDKLNKGGFDLDAFLGKTAKATGIAALGTMAYELFRDPLETGAAFAKDIALEGAALAAKAPLAVAGAVPMILESTPAGEGSDIVSEEDKARVQADFIASQDAGFLDIDRGPEEAAPANSTQGFLSR